MSVEEREHWDHRYATEGARSVEPATFLVEVAGRFPPEARILDVGGGSGRNAIWLASRGHRVTIVDISMEGLRLAQTAASEAEVDIATIAADLDNTPLPHGPWDVIVDFHFIKRHLLPQFMEVLRPGGLLVFCRATTKNLERNERPPRPYLLDQGEGWDLLGRFELLIAREGWSVEGRHEFEALAQRPA
ncbi:MAG: class I SAM-dependent methyltransferase [Acidimicrobiia bacterium]|nr:class I SAM-dependent methyltransferase [Acidimicrobiia bacterium]